MSTNDLIRTAVDLVIDDVETTTAAQRLAAVADHPTLDAAVGQVLVALARNPLVDVTGIRAARLLRQAAETSAPRLAQAG